MTFKWLPDAELDPHPRLTWFAECCFDLTVLALYRKEEILPPDYRLEPGTLVVSNHQRDADVPILTTVLCRREGMYLRWPLPFFASREDFFRRGFLAGHLRHWPRPLRGLLTAISLGWFFRIVRAEPMRRVREFTLNEARAELPECAGATHWLNPRGLREASTDRDGESGWRFWGLRRLRAEARATLDPGFRATVIAQLERFAALLDAGRVVYFAPEGTISCDGRFGRFRAGTGRLVRLAAAPPPILPLALSYDPLGPGRLRVIIHVGTPLRAYNSDDGARFNAVLEMEIRKLYRVNASHLASRFLASGPDRFTGDDFVRWFARARSGLVAARIGLDPLLAHADPDRLARERLDDLQRKALVTRTGTHWRNRWPRDARPGWRRPAEIVRYFDNALADHLRALAPGMELRP